VYCDIDSFFVDTKISKYVERKLDLKNVFKEAQSILSEIEFIVLKECFVNDKFLHEVDLPFVKTNGLQMIKNKAFRKLKDNEGFKQKYQDVMY